MASLCLIELASGCASNTTLQGVSEASLADLASRTALGGERDALPAKGEPVSAVSRVGDLAVWAERTSGPLTRLVATDGRTTWTLPNTSAALSFDRPVLSSDGALVAFVYAPRGIASIGVVPFRGGEPLQLTNVGMERKKRAPGRPPDGFVPVPEGDSLIFVGDRLEWSTSQGRMSVRLPPGLVSKEAAP